VIRSIKSMANESRAFIACTAPSLVGFGFWLAWAWSFYFVMYTGINDSSSGMIGALEWGIHLLALCLTLGLVYIISKFHTKSFKSVNLKGVLVLASIFSVLGTLPITAAAFTHSVDILVLWPARIVGAAISGSGSGLIMLLWGSMYARQKSSTIWASTFISIVIAIVAYGVLANMRPQAYASGVVLSIMVSSIFLFNAITRYPSVSKPNQSSRFPAKSHTIPHYGKVIFAVFVSEVICGYVKGSDIAGNQTGTVNDWVIFAYAGVIFIGTVIFFAKATYVVMSRKSPLSVIKMYRPIALLMAAGFALFIFLPVGVKLVGASLVYLAQTWIEAQTWIMLACTSHASTKRSSVYIFSIGQFCKFLGLFMGVMLGQTAFMLGSGWDNWTYVLLVVLMSYAILLATQLLIPEKSIDVMSSGSKDEEFLEAHATTSSICAKPPVEVDRIPTTMQQHDVDERLAEIALEYKLTEREQHVLDLLAQGRTIAYISRSIYVSESTTKTHIRSIYKKLEVHTRTDLLNLIYR